jgi:hypothetical protein
LKGGYKKILSFVAALKQYEREPIWIVQKQINLFTPSGIKPEFLGCTAHNVITAPIALPRLQNTALKHDK